jgi:hypothetical protein
MTARFVRELVQIVTSKPHFLIKHAAVTTARSAPAKEEGIGPGEVLDRATLQFFVRESLRDDRSTRPM